MEPFDAKTLNRVWHSLLVETLDESAHNTAMIASINTDSRAIKPMDCFVALVGEHFDGHDFCQAAVNQGANLLVVESKQPIDCPQIVVKDTRRALGLLAAEIRRQFGGQVIGLTGSVGKTTTKQMLANICQQVGKTHMTQGNLNNDLGVPFTWFALPEGCQFAVIEMGANHQGEIAYLAEIVQPDVGLVLNAGQAHLAGFGGLDGVAKGKGELFSALQSHQTAVINADDAYASWWQDMAANAGSKVTFSMRENAGADVYASDIQLAEQRFTLHYGQNTATVNLPVVGKHYVQNAIAAAAAAYAAGLPMAAVVAGLQTFTLAAGRQQLIQLGQVVIIDDTYNANPQSMQAAGDALSFATGYKIMVLGDMAELGEAQIEIHAQLGASLQHAADAFFCTGTMMQHFAQHNQRAQWFLDKQRLSDELLQWIASNVDKTVPTTILVKGSRSMKMETIVEFLRQQINPVEE